MNIPENVLQDIRNSVKIEDVIGESVKLKKTGKEFTGLCPFHPDSVPSFSVNPSKQVYFCQSCKKGGDVITFIREGQGITFPEAVKQIADRSGIQIGSNGTSSGNGKYTGSNKPEATFDYTSPDGTFLFQVVRTKDKKFPQRHLDKNGNWQWGLDGISPVLYHLPALIKSVSAGNTIFICEGEKDVENIEKLGLTATTNPMGAGKWLKWSKLYNPYLKGVKVVCLPDCDKAGRDHAHEVAQSLTGVAKSVRILELPGLANKQDVSDWIDSGGDRDQLIALVKACKLWDSADKPEAKSLPDNDKPAETEFVSSDRWLANFLQKHYGTEIRFNHSSKSWHLWDGKIWKKDNTGQIFRYGVKNR